MSEELIIRLQRMEDIEEIRKLYVAYGRHLDDGDAAAYASLFARDAKLRLGGVMRADGRGEIQAAATKLMAGMAASGGKSLHLLDSPRIEVDGDEASGECVWTAVSAQAGEAPKITMMGRHVDQFVREDGRWRFALRKGLLDLGQLG
jgi:uncharacterized protein (TIGR02246 family)